MGVTQPNNAPQQSVYRTSVAFDPTHVEHAQGDGATAPSQQEPRLHLVRRSRQEACGTADLAFGPCHPRDHAESMRKLPYGRGGVFVSRGASTDPRRVPELVAVHLDQLQMARHHDEWHLRWESHVDFLARHDGFVAHLRDAVPAERDALRSAGMQELRLLHRTLGERAAVETDLSTKINLSRGQELVGMFLNPEPVLREARGVDGKVSITNLAAIVRPLHSKLHAALGMLTSYKDPLNLDEPEANIYNRDFYALIHAPLSELMSRAVSEASDGAAYIALVEREKNELNNRAHHHSP